MDCNILKNSSSPTCSSNYHPTFARTKARNHSTGDDIEQDNGKNASIKIAKLSLRKLLEQNPQKQEDNVCDSLLKASKVELLEIWSQSDQNIQQPHQAVDLGTKIAKAAGEHNLTRIGPNQPLCQRLHPIISNHLITRILLLAWDIDATRWSFNLLIIGGGAHPLSFWFCSRGLLVSFFYYWSIFVFAEKLYGSSYVGLQLILEI